LPERHIRSTEHHPHLQSTQVQYSNHQYDNYHNHYYQLPKYVSPQSFCLAVTNATEAIKQGYIKTPTNNMTTFNNIDLINQQGPHDRDKRWICRECGTENAVGDACPCGNETE
jgi:hypothetical protein